MPEQEQLKRTLHIAVTDAQWAALKRTAAERELSTRQRVTMAMLVRDALKSAGYGE